MGSVAEMADRVAVTYAGRIAEVAPTINIFEHAKHRYIQALLESIPNIRTEDKILRMIPGSPPDLTEVPLPLSLQMQARGAQARINGGKLRSLMFPL